MSAANPFSATTTDQKPREPSMEEILASIRRIIADDQSLPGRGSPPETVASSAPEPAAEAGPALHVEPPAPAHVHDALPMDTAPVLPSPAHVEPSASSSTQDYRAVAPEPPAGSILQHGAVAAPQFATPSGPIDYAEYFEDPEPVVQPAIEPEPTLSRTTETPTVSESVIRNPAADPAPASFASTEAAYRHDEADEPYESPLEPARQDDHSEVAGLFSAATDTSIQSAFNMLAATRLADNSDELKAMVREMIRPLLRSWLDDNLPTMVEKMVRAEIERVARGGR